MPCYRPLEGWRAVGGGFTLDASLGERDRPLTVPCGYCMGCRLERSRVWAVRMMHETQMHDEAIFVTLSYDEDQILERGSLVPRDMTLFLKRLRKYVSPQKIRYYQCGEYGTQTQRPHHHLILWGWRPSDSQIHSGSGRDRLYTSLVLEKLWEKKGFAPFGEVTFESCAYCSRYITKKILGDRAEEHYRRVDPETGEIFSLVPEYSSMSNGIGLAWIERYWRSVYAHDHVIMRGARMAPPRYYDTWLEKNQPDTWARIRAARSSENYEPYRPRDGDYGPRSRFFQARSAKQLRAGETISKRRLQERNAL